MGILRHVQLTRNNPYPDERSLWNFRRWSFGNMRPLHAIQNTIAVTAVDTVVLSIFIPANTWAQLHRLIVWAHVRLVLNPPNPILGRRYNEKYDIQAIGPFVRTANELIANASVLTEFVWERQFQLGRDGVIREMNATAIGIETLNQAQGVDHQIKFTPSLAPYDPTVDSYLDFLISDTNAIGNDQIGIISAQAYIQAPLNLGRMPQ